MFFYQYVTMLALVVMALSKSSRRGALIVLTAYLVYILAAIDASAIYYYSLTAAIHLMVGVALHKQNRVSALASYMLVLTNLMGFFMWYLYMTPNVYNNTSMVLLVVQATCLLPKGIFNGCRNYIQHTMASIARTDNCKQNNRTNAITSSKAK